jgi:ribosomal 30S subunit maturation factor RimM
MSKKILIAKIISARGIKGEVKIMYFGDDVKNLEKYPIFDTKNNQIDIKENDDLVINIGMPASDQLESN